MKNRLNYNELVGDLVKELKTDYMNLLSSYKDEINKAHKYNDELKEVKVKEATDYYYNEARVLKERIYNKILTKFEKVQVELNNKPIEDNRSIQEKILNELQKNNAFLEIKAQLEKDNISYIEKLYYKYSDNDDIVEFIKVNITGNENGNMLLEKINEEQVSNQELLSAWVLNTRYGLISNFDEIDIGEALSRNIAKDFGKNQLDAIRNNFFDI